MESTEVFQLFMSVLMLPVFKDLFAFVTGGGDSTVVVMAKWFFLLLPVMAMIWAYWVTMIGVISLVVRPERRAFMTQVMMTWWDLGHSVLSYWSGIIKFAGRLIFFTMLCLRFIAVGLIFLVHDILMIPWRMMANVGGNVVSGGVPWIAVCLTMFWCFLEAVIFTYVTTPLVLDTLSNMTGGGLTETQIRFPLFMFMLFIVLGSYSVLSTWATALSTKNIGSIVKIGAIEMVAMFVEVVFLYREFVDALVPWFAQHSSSGFELGIFGTLAIAGTTWFGVRAMSWFLFASSGTPMIQAIIQGHGIKMKTGSAASNAKAALVYTDQFVGRLKDDEKWLRLQIEEVIGAFVLPPLQIVACAINFVTLLLTNKHLFELPFKDINELREARMMMQKLEKKKAS